MKDHARSVGDRRRFRKRRRTRVLPWCPWNWGTEPGDLMISAVGNLYRLETPHSLCARNGILYPRRILPPAGFSRAVLEDGEIYWVR